MSYDISRYEIEKLDVYASIEPGFAFKSERFTDNLDDIPLVKGENVHQGYIDWAGAKHWPVDDFDSHSRYQLVPGDIVLAMDRPWVTAGLKWSYIKLHDPKSLLVQRVARIRARGRLDQDYLRHIISSDYFANYLQPIVTGVNVPHISGKQIGDFRIPIPDLAVQRKIAAILTAYDDLIETNKRSVALLEKMAEEIYREWFIRMRFPGYHNTKFVKGAPEGWEVTQFGQIANMIMGQSPKSEFYNDSGQGVPFHQGVGTYGDRFPRNITFCTTNGRKAQKGDILFSVRAPVGRLNIADCDLIIGRGIAAIRQKDGNNSYLYYLLRTTFVNEDIIGNGSIFNSVGKDELAGFAVLRHPGDLIVRFEAIARPIDQQIEALIHSNSALTKTRDLLLPRLISGKLPVADLDIQFPPSMCEGAKGQDRGDASG